MVIGAYALARFVAPGWIMTRVTDFCATNGLGSLSYSRAVVGVFPPTLVVEDADYEYLGKYSKAEAKARAISAGLDPFALLGGEIRFREIMLDNPVATLSYIESAPSSAGGFAFSGFPEVERFLIQKGELAIVTLSPDSVVKFMNIGVSAEYPDKRGEAYAKCDFNIKFARYLNANVAAAGKFHFYPPNITFRNWALSATFLPENAFVSPTRLSFDGAYNLEDKDLKFSTMAFATPAGEIKLSGDLSPLAPAFAGTVDARLNLEKLWPESRDKELFLTTGATLADEGLKLENIAVRMGQSQGSGKLNISFAGERPEKIKGEFNFARLRLNFRDLAPIKKKQASDSDSGIANFFRDGPEIDIRAKISSLEKNDLLFRDVSLNLTGKNGEYVIYEPAAKWCDGKISGNFAWNANRDAWSASLNGAKINFGDALKQLGAPWFTGGSVEFALKLNSSAPGVEALAGDGKLEAGGARFAALQSVADALAFIGGGGDFSGLAVSAPFVIKNGVARFSPVTAQGVGVRANGSATANLAKKYFDGKLSLRWRSFELPLVFKGPFGDIAIGIDRNKSDH